MDIDKALDAAESAESWGRKALKFLAATAVVFGLLGVLLWLVFYSIFTANVSFVIPLRQWYQNTYWQTEGRFLKVQRAYPPFDPIYTFRTYKIEPDGTFTYVFLGKFYQLSLPDQTIYLFGYDNKPYVFNIAQSLYDDGQGTIWLHVSSMENSQTKGQSFMKDDIVDILNQTPFDHNAIFQVYWNDSRTLNQIQNIYAQDSSQSLNAGSPKKPIFIQY